jgi:hypothetical protein
MIGYVKVEAISGIILLHFILNTNRELKAKTGSLGFGVNTGALPLRLATTIYQSAQNRL